jgi:hypothetical protein
MHENLCRRRLSSVWLYRVGALTTVAACSNVGNVRRNATNPLCPASAARVAIVLIQSHSQTKRLNLSLAVCKGGAAVEEELEHLVASMAVRRVEVELDADWQLGQQPWRHEPVQCDSVALGLDPDPGPDPDPAPDPARTLGRACGSGELRVRLG